MTIGDLVILNVLFLLCCLPIFTIGAAQAGLYTGLRVLADKEDDSSPAAAFFRGFSSGFGKITIVHSLLMVLVLVISCTGMKLLWNVSMDNFFIWALWGAAVFVPVSLTALAYGLVAWPREMKALVKSILKRG